jgi:hypothetical protein
LWTIYLGWPWTAILLISASQVAADVSHECLVKNTFSIDWKWLVSMVRTTVCLPWHRFLLTFRGLEH